MPSTRASGRPTRSRRSTTWSSCRGRRERRTRGTKRLPPALATPCRSPLHEHGRRGAWKVWCARRKARRSGPSYKAVAVNGGSGLQVHEGAAVPPGDHEVVRHGSRGQRLTLVQMRWTGGATYRTRCQNSSPATSSCDIAERWRRRRATRLTGLRVTGRRHILGSRLTGTGPASRGPLGRGIRAAPESDRPSGG